MTTAEPSLEQYSAVNILLGLMALPVGLYYATGGVYSLTGGGLIGLVVLYFPLAYIALGWLAGWRRSSRAFLALVAHNAFVTVFLVSWWYVDPAAFEQSIWTQLFVGLHLLALVLAIRARNAEPKFVSYSG